MRGIKIGSTRGWKTNPSGYYTIITDELKATVRQVVDQRPHRRGADWQAILRPRARGPNEAF
ncbi:MAG: hypothetical protein KGN01_06355 [Patescibacteria group bacterium]|nr:hypothetical protein [Patescibacteria group bacterium]